MGQIQALLPLDSAPPFNHAGEKAAASSGAKGKAKDILAAIRVLK